MAEHSLAFRVELERIVKLARQLANEDTGRARGPDNPQGTAGVMRARRLLTEGFEGVDYRTAMKLVSGELEASELIEKYERQHRYIEEALF